MTPLTLLAVTILGPAHAGECVPFPTLFAKLAAEQVPAEAVLIEIRPFKNDTGQKGDEWLVQGIPHLLKRYLSSGSGLAALTQPTEKAQYKIEGMFQHTQKWLRTFVQFKDSKGKMIAQFPVETPYPLHKQFFSGPKDAALQISKKLERELDHAALQAIENETSSVAAFQNLIKGRAALETYEPNQIEVALIWFQESRREDHKFASAYDGLLDAYSFLILNHKQKGEAYQPYIEAIQNTIKERNKRTGQTIDAAEYPILKAHVHFVSGQRALAKNMPAAAAKEFQAALEALPIDAATAYALSESYAKLGNAKEAEKYRKHAEALNPCLKK
ncbi:MAG: hypothetical protein HY466_07750 [Deltaproteobacteria bacterium]|nr:hypothetical protein [Deltaproteobacteria bacterium]